MKVEKKYTVLIVTLILTSLTFSFGTTISSVPDNSDFETDFKTNYLGEIEGSFETDHGLYCIEYLDGVIYGIEYQGNKVHKYDATTGDYLGNFSVGFNMNGLTTDGTNFYGTMYTLSPPNGTIVKFDNTGTEISRMHITIGSNLLKGMTWDGDYLWVFQENPESLLRINPDNGFIYKNITIGSYFFDLNYYDNQIWGCEYSYDRIMAYDENTGKLTNYYSSPYHFDSGIDNNGTHFIQTRYIDISDPFEVSFSRLPTEPGEILLESHQLLTLPVDIAFDGGTIFMSENNSWYIYGFNSSTFANSVFFPADVYCAGITVIYDNYLLVAPASAPYNLYTYSLAGDLLVNQTTSLTSMARSLTFDGTNVWAMCTDNILYKLNPTNMTIIDQYTVGPYYGISYDEDKEVIWAINKITHEINYFDPETGEFGTNSITLTSPITPGEMSLIYDGEYLVIATTYDGGHLLKILPGELDEEPEPTPTPTPTPTPSTTPFTGLFGLPNLYENLIFLGFGIVGMGIIAGIIALLRRSKK